jgi:hypothetical protein
MYHGTVAPSRTHDETPRAYSIRLINYQRDRNAAATLQTCKSVSAHSKVESGTARTHIPVALNAFVFRGSGRQLFVGRPPRSEWCGGWDVRFPGSVGVGDDVPDETEPRTRRRNKETDGRTTNYRHPGHMRGRADGRGSALTRWWLAPF